MLLFFLFVKKKGALFFFLSFIDAVHLVRVTQTHGVKRAVLHKTTQNNTQRGRRRERCLLLPVGGDVVPQRTPGRNRRCLSAGGAQEEEVGARRVAWADGGAAAVSTVRK